MNVETSVVARDGIADHGMDQENGVHTTSSEIKFENIPLDHILLFQFDDL